MRWTRAVAPAVMLTLALSPTSARATDGHFLHGVGAVNSAMGGAGIAAPVSLLGTFYLNPAGLMAFDGSRIEFGFEMFKPDRTVASSVTFQNGFTASGETTSKSDFVPIPAMGWSTKINRNVAVGIGMLGVGGFGVDYSASAVDANGVPENPVLAPRPYGFGTVYSNYQLMRITPTVAYAPTDRLWLGFSANVDWASLAVDPMPVGPPSIDPGPDGTLGTADDMAFYSGAANADGAFGWGFQAGLIYNVNDMIALGASFQSQQQFEDFEFNTVFTNPNDPSFGTARTINFNLDIPMVVGGGLQLKPLPQFTLAGDFRYIFYESTDGFEIPDGQSVFNQDGSVAGFGWRDIYSIHGGADFRVNEFLSVRGGYNYAQSPITHEFSFVNVPAPGIVEHHATFGIGLRPSRRFEISAAYYHAFENDCHGQLLTPGGPMPGSSVNNSLSENSLLIQFSFATRGSI